MIIARFLACATLLSAGALFAQEKVSCSSDDMKRHFCSADTRGGVRLLRQHSDAACREGDSWGYNRRGVWVDRGCRADFVVGEGSDRDDRSYRRDDDRDRDDRWRRRRDRDDDRERDRGDSAYGTDGYGGNRGSSTLTCSSNDGKRHYCNTDTRGGVRLQRQRSDSACREGYSWGYDERGVWVDHGCRADFEVRR